MGIEPTKWIIVKLITAPKAENYIFKDPAGKVQIFSLMNALLLYPVKSAYDYGYALYIVCYAHLIEQYGRIN